MCLSLTQLDTDSTRKLIVDALIECAMLSPQIRALKMSIKDKYSIAEFRKNLAYILECVHHKHNITTIEKYGNPFVAIISNKDAEIIQNLKRLLGEKYSFESVNKFIEDFKNNSIKIS